MEEIKSWKINVGCIKNKINTMYLLDNLVTKWNASHMLNWLYIHMHKSKIKLSTWISENSSKNPWRMNTSSCVLFTGQIKRQINWLCIVLCEVISQKDKRWCDTDEKSFRESHLSCWKLFKVQILPIVPWERQI